MEENNLLDGRSVPRSKLVQFLLLHFKFLEVTDIYLHRNHQKNIFRKPPQQQQEDSRLQYGNSDEEEVSIRQNSD
jgi:hypothetical protein